MFTYVWPLCEYRENNKLSYVLRCMCVCTDMGHQQILVCVRVHVCVHVSHNQNIVVSVGGLVFQHQIPHYLTWTHGYK